MKKGLAASVLPLLFAVGLSSACSKDPPPKPSDEPKKTTPVPSDMVFNDFVPATGGGAGIVGVKTDGGILEGGADLGSAAAAPGGPPAEAADAPNKLQVIEPGAEPRVARRYTFAANRAAKRLMTTKQSVGREGGAAGQEVAFALTGEFVPKQVTPNGARFEMKVLGIDIPDMPAAQKAQAAAQLAMFKGMTGQFDVSKQGEVGEIDFKADERMQGQGAEVILQSLQQAAELLLPPLPDAPIGTGAKWERSVERAERGMVQKAKHAFTLKEVTAEGGVVDATTEISMPKHALQQRGAPPGTTEEVTGKGHYTYTFKFDHVATKVEGEMTITRRIEAAGPNGQKQSMAEIIKLKNQLEAAK